MIEAQTVTVVSVATTTDKYGDRVRVETQTVVSGCLVAPRSSSERGDGDGPAVIAGASVYMPAGTVVNPDDHLLIGGVRYDVTGEPGVWGSAGVEVAVTRWRASAHG